MKKRIYESDIMNFKYLQIICYFMFCWIFKVYMKIIDYNRSVNYYFIIIYFIKIYEEREC